MVYRKNECNKIKFKQISTYREFTGDCIESHMNRMLEILMRIKKMGIRLSFNFGFFLSVSFVCLFLSVFLAINSFLSVFLCQFFFLFKRNLFVIKLTVGYEIFGLESLPGLGIDPLALLLEVFFFRSPSSGSIP